MRFSREWCQFFDEAVPRYVKQTYLPKPPKRAEFNERDFLFFRPSVRALSEQLGSDRDPHRPLRYFSQARNRSAYLLYLLPFQAAKMAWVLQSGAWGPQEDCETLRILDLGAGPGTATLATLFSLVALGVKRRTIEITLTDKESAILKDAQALLEIAVREHLPQLKGQIKVQSLVGDWETANLPPSDLILCAHVLNERAFSERALRQILRLAETRPRHGTVFLEPAIRTSSDLLIRLRKELIAGGHAMRAPCFHAQRCPLEDNRDWCHTSAPAVVPGKWLERFGKDLSESGRGRREFLKMTYLWTRGGVSPASNRDSESEYVRVLSDAIPTKNGPRILVCRPDRPELVAPETLAETSFRGSASKLIPTAQRDRRRVDRPIHARRVR